MNDVVEMLEPWEPTKNCAPLYATVSASSLAATPYAAICYGDSERLSDGNVYVEEGTSLAK
jgi:hypothetical protein